MWIGFKKGLPRSEDGKFATVANDSGIDQRGDGYIELENMMDSGQHVAPGLEHMGTAFDGPHKSALVGRPDATPQKQPVSPAVGVSSYSGSQDGKTTTSNPKRVTDPDKEPDPEDDDARYADEPAEGDNSVAWWTLRAMSESATAGAVAAEDGAP
jgi:hypothetical protein